MTTEPHPPTASDDQDWEPCPAGTLSGLSVRLKHEHRADQFWKRAAMASMLLCVVTLGWVASRRLTATSENFYGGLSCAEVKASLPSYMAGRAESDLASKIKLHLAECVHCRAAVEKMQSSAMPQARLHRNGACPDCGADWSLVRLEMAVAAALPL